MVVRNDFLYYIVDNMRFSNIIMFDNFSDSYLLALIDVFNKSDYKEVFKYNNNLTLKQVKDSVNIFFNHINNNNYDYVLKNGIINWNIGNGVVLGSNNGSYKKLIDEEYLKEWEKYNYYYWKN